MFILKPAFSSSIYKRMFWRLYLQYAMIFCLLFLGVTLLFSSQANRQNRENTELSANSLSNYSASLLQECQKLAVSIGRCEALLDLSSSATSSLNFSELDSTVFFAAQHNLVSYKALNRHISTLDVYLHNREYIISDYGTITLESFCQSIFGQTAQQCADYLRPLGSGRFLFLAGSPSQEPGMPAGPLYVLSLTNNSGTRYGNLFLFLDKKQMAEDVKALLGAEIEYYIFDENKNLILTNSGAAGDPALLYDTLSSKSFSCAADSGSGWICFAGYPAAFLRHQRLILSLLFGSILLLIIIGLIPLTHAVCCRNYAPIRELASIVSHNSSASEEKELEYEALKSAVSAVFENKALLEEQLFVYKPLLINSLLLQLLSDTAADRSAVLTGLKNLGISFRHPVFLCVCFISAHMEPDFLEQAAQTVNGSLCSCCFFSYRKDAGAFLLNCADTDSCDHSLKRLCEILDTENAILSYGSGGIAHGLKYAPSSYSQALCALEYLSCDPPSKGVSYDSIVQAGALAWQRPSVLHSLSTVLGAGCFPDAAGNLEQYFNVVCCSGLVRKSDLSYVKEQLLAAIPGVCRDRNIQLDTTALSTCEPLCPADFETLRHLCLDICQELETLAMQQEETQLVSSSRQLLSYLEEHLCDEDLSLSSLSEAFSVSESSMSRRIKQLTGSTFLAWVTQKRIDHACQLLKTSDMSIYDIAKASGYENDITFRRLFKKYTGVTPGNYRKHQPEL